MIALIVAIARLVLLPPDADATVRFTGDRGAAALVFVVLGGVLLVGVVSIIAGAFQLVHGRRSPHLVRAVLFAGLAVLALGMLVGVLL